MAADHRRLAVVDQLLAVGTPIDAADPDWGRQALRVAAQNGRAAGIEHLLARGADPDLRDPQHQRTALEWYPPHLAARPRRGSLLRDGTRRTGDV